MARRRTKGEGALIGLLIIIGLPIYLVSQLVQSIGWILPVIAIAGAIALYTWYQNDKKQKRLAYLRQKYGDEDIVQKIFNGYFWQGQTEAQLMDSLGPPVAVDNKLLKTKVREVWKYRQQGVNRFALRITVEDGYVSSWDQKA